MSRTQKTSPQEDLKRDNIFSESAGQFNMLTEIKEIRLDGLVLTCTGAGYAAQEAWLPAAEWSMNPDEWREAYDSLEPGEELDVVEFPPPFAGFTRRLVSRRRLTDYAVDDSWLQRALVMRVEEVTKTLFRGKIGPISAFARQQPYIQYLDSRIWGDSARDHAVVGRGDLLGGLVIATGLIDGAVELDLAQYLDVAQSEIESRILAHQDRDATTDRSAEASDQRLGLREGVPAKISPLLLVENNSQCRESIQAILLRNKVAVDAVSNAEALNAHLSRLVGIPGRESARLALRQYRMAIIDANLEDGLVDRAGFRIIQELQDVPDCAILLMTAAETTLSDIARWGQLGIQGYLQKPFTVRTLLESIEAASEIRRVPFLEVVSAEVSTKEPERDSPATSRGPTPYTEIADEEALTELASILLGSVIHVFEIHSRSLRARSILPRTASRLAWDRLRGKIGKSPIKDVAFARSPIDVASAAGDARHFWTQQMMPYESFYGVPVSVPGPYRYALVAFHPRRDAFDTEFKVAARICAERIGRALEREMLRANRGEVTTLAATGLVFETLSHELRNDITPLQSDAVLVHNALDAMNKTVDEKLAEVREPAQRILSCADDAIDKLAALSGVRGAKQPISVQSCLIRAATACRKVAHDTLRQASIGRIFIDIPTFPPEENWHLRTTQAALTIVFFNLYLNAAQQIDLMSGIRKGGWIRHSCERRRDTKGRPLGIVRIHDTGPGIHPDDWERIFAPGYSTKPNGTGMGLYICRHLLADMGDAGGRSAAINVTRSVLWDGTTFTVMLPLCS